MGLEEVLDGDQAGFDPHLPFRDVTGMLLEVFSSGRP